MRQRFPGRFLTHWDTALVLLILLGVIWFRLTAYGDLRLSIATLDTESYMAASRAPLLSWRAFTGERLFGTNALYQLAKAQNCSIQAMSVPAIGKEAHRQDQVCFEGVVFVQTAMSIVGWGLFVFGFAMTMNAKLARVAAAGVLGVFAFVPQIADWDSILNSQSPAFSWFALALGFIFLVLWQSKRPDARARVRNVVYLLALGGLVSLAVWIFFRDPNVYTAALFALMLLGLGLIARRKSVPAIVVAAVLLSLCVVALVSSVESGRWKVPLAGAFQQYILESPSWVAKMQQGGMPDPSSAGYAAWFNQHAASSYAFMLLRHPRFVISTVFDNINYLFSDNNQPYFKTPDLPLRNFALQVGDWLHPRSTSVILVAALSLLALASAAIKTRNQIVVAWTIIYAWLLVSAVATMVLTFFADPAGVERHVLLSLVWLRLLMWMGLLILMDLSQAWQPPASV